MIVSCFVWRDDVEKAIDKTVSCFYGFVSGGSLNNDAMRFFFCDADVRDGLVISDVDDEGVVCGVIAGDDGDGSFKSFFCSGESGFGRDVVDMEFCTGNLGDFDACDDKPSIRIRIDSDVELALMSYAYLSGECVDEIDCGFAGGNVINNSRVIMKENGEWLVINIEIDAPGSVRPLLERIMIVGVSRQFLLMLIVWDKKESCKEQYYERYEDEEIGS